MLFGEDIDSFCVMINEEETNLPDSQFEYLVECVPADTSKKPVDNLQKWDDAESKTEAKEPSKGGNEVNWTHSDASLKL